MKSLLALFIVTIPFISYDKADLPE